MILGEESLVKKYQNIDSSVIIAKDIYHLAKKEKVLLEDGSIGTVYRMLHKDKNILLSSKPEYFLITKKMPLLSSIIKTFFKLSKKSKK